MNPYLFFDGTCEEAFQRYAEILGGRITALHRQSEAPADAQGNEGCAGGPPLAPEKIMHVSMEFRGQVLMASDCPPGLYRAPQGFAVQVATKSPEEAERFYAALAEDGMVLMPLAPTFWAARFGMLVDRFGTPWMINCELQAAQPA